MAKFAAKTNVDITRSQIEIARILEGYGCTDFMSGAKDGKAVIGFKANGRMVKVEVVMPTLEEASRTKIGTRMSPKQANGAWEQQKRQRWRALALVVKAKLEAVESGVATFDQEFMSYIVMAGGQTIGDKFIPQIAEAYASGKSPVLLLN